MQPDFLDSGYKLLLEGYDSVFSVTRYFACALVCPLGVYKHTYIHTYVCTLYVSNECGSNSFVQSSDGDPE